MTTQTEMYDQTEAFPAPPKTKVEFADEFLEHFQSDVESAEKSLINARAKLAAAQILRNDAEENLRRERVAEGIATVEEVALDMKRSAEAAGMGLSFQVNGEEPIVITEAHDVDPITGEVDSVTGTVCVTYPGDTVADVRITDVGSRTQYGELVADYLATLPAVSPHRDDPVAAYRVIGVDDEIDRDLRSAVSPDDYGVELAVVRRVDVQEANELLEDAVR